MGNTINTSETHDGLYIRLGNEVAVRVSDDGIQDAINEIEQHGRVTGGLILPENTTVIEIPQDERETVISALRLREHNSQAT